MWPKQARKATQLWPTQFDPHKLGRWYSPHKQNYEGKLEYIIVKQSLKAYSGHHILSQHSK